MKKYEILAVAILAACLAVSLPVINKRMEKVKELKRFDKIEEILKKGSNYPAIDLQ